jgi:hypothetical protein
LNSTRNACRALVATGASTYFSVLREPPSVQYGEVLFPKAFAWVT